VLAGLVWVTEVAGLEPFTKTLLSVYVVILTSVALFPSLQGCRVEGQETGLGG
jgi:hypothetical protein